MAISVSYYSGSYTYTAAKTQNKSGTNNSITPVGCFFAGTGSGFSVQQLKQIYSNLSNLDGYTTDSNFPMLAAYYDTSGTPTYQVVYCIVTYASLSVRGRIVSTTSAYNGSNVYLYDIYGGGLNCKCDINVSNGTLHGLTFNLPNTKVSGSPGYVAFSYPYRNTRTVSTLHNGVKYTFDYTKYSNYSYQETTPASASISCTGLTMSGLTPYVNSSYSGRVLISTDNTNFTYLSGTSVNNILSTSSRSVYTAILSVSGSTLGLSNGNSYSRSTLDLKVKEYNANEVASSFDSLYNTASNATRSSTLSGYISTLNGYLSTISSHVGTSNTIYTSRSSRMSTLNSKLTTLRNQEEAAINNAATNFDNLHNSISGDVSTVTNDNLSSLQSYLNTISSNSSTSDSRYTTRKTKYDTLKRDYDAYQIRISNLSQVGTNIAGINTAIANTKNTILPEMGVKYNNTYNTGRNVYNAVLEKINYLKTSL